MKHILTIALALLVATTGHAASRLHVKETTARLGDSAYRAGNYTEAAAFYEEVLADGATSADLHYNLGNTYFRLEQYGLAILNYERALRLKPGMDDAKENLALANSRTTDRITVLPKLFVVRWYESLRSHVTPGTWRVIWLVIFALLAASTALFVTARSIGVRKGTFAAIIVTAVLLVLATLLLLSSTSHFNSHSEAIVMQPAISVKSSPEQQSTDKLVLHEGTKVTITESLAGWDRITLADGTSGWCETANIERI